MHTAVCHFKGLAPYSMSRAHGEPKLNRENSDAYEERTWIERGHYTEDGHVFIPPAAFKFSLATAARQLSIQIPGKGKATYTKFFDNGVQVAEGPILSATRDTVRRQRIHANADGKRGSGKRVWRSFPTVDEWEAQVQYFVLADEITKDVFEQVVRHSGLFIGVGQYRPENGGTCGRFALVKLDWS